MSNKNKNKSESENENENDDTPLNMQELNNAMAQLNKVGKIIDKLTERSKAFTGIKRTGDQQLILDSLASMTEIAKDLAAATKELSESENAIFKNAIFKKENII